MDNRSAFITYKISYWKILLQKYKTHILDKSFPLTCTYMIIAEISVLGQLKLISKFKAQYFPQKFSHLLYQSSKYGFLACLFPDLQ